MELTRVVTIFSAKSRNLSLQPTQWTSLTSLLEYHLFALHTITFLCSFPNQIHWQPSTSCCNVTCVMKIKMDFFLLFRFYGVCVHEGKLWCLTEVSYPELSYLSFHTQCHMTAWQWSEFNRRPFRITWPLLAWRPELVLLPDPDHVISATVRLFAGREHRRRTNKFRSETEALLFWSDWRLKWLFCS